MKIVVNCVHPDGLSPDEQVFIHLIRNNRELADAMYSKNLLKIDKDHLVSTGQVLGWNDNVQEIILSNVKTPKQEGVEEWIERYRQVFKNKKAGAMGSKQSCIDKMRRFIQSYPEFNNPELIISAATRYVNTQRVNNYAYLQRADYVISKKDSDTTNSRLAAFCEEVLDLESNEEKFNQAGRQTI
jgi:hypothetical protein